MAYRKSRRDDFYWWRQGRRVNEGLQDWSVNSPGGARREPNQVLRPYFTPAPGRYPDVGPLVTIACDTPQTTIYYTTNGTDPTNLDTVYTAPVQITGPSTDLRAIAYDDNAILTPSPIRRGTYFVVVQDPVFNPVPGQYTGTTDVEITTASAGASIFYRIDGGAWTPYSAAVSIQQNSLLESYASDVGLTDSNIVSGNYTIKAQTPVFVPPPGDYADQVSISIGVNGTEGTGFNIHYTTDGSTPNIFSPIFEIENPVIFNAGVHTLKAIILGPNHVDSDIKTGIYTVTVTPPEPSYSVNDGTQDVEPDTVADFLGDRNGGVEYFRKKGTKATFDELFNYTGDISTMQDSDGLIKWSAHNFSPLPNNWNNLTNTTITIDQEDPIGASGAFLIAHTASTADAFDDTGSYPIDQEYTARVQVKWNGTPTTGQVRVFVAGRSAYFDPANDYAMTSGTGVVSTSAVNLGNGWWQLEVIATRAAGSSGIYVSEGTTTTENTTDSFFFFEYHCFMSSLGGMVNNPDDDWSYIPTTTAPVILPRRKSYFYSSLDLHEDFGLFIDSDAATNLLFPSTPDDINWLEKNATITPDTDMLGMPAVHVAGSGIVASIANSGAASNGAGVFYSASIFVEQDDINPATTVTLILADEAENNGVECEFDIAAGTPGIPIAYGTATDARGYIDRMSGSVYRLVVSGAAVGDGLNAFLGLRIGNFNVRTAGAQIEAGPFATSYIPTDTQEETRPAQTLAIEAGDLNNAGPETSYMFGGFSTYTDNDNQFEVRMLEQGPTPSLDIYLSAINGTGQIIFDHSNTAGIQSPPDRYDENIYVMFALAAWYDAVGMNAAADGIAGTAVSDGAYPNLVAQDMKLCTKFSGPLAMFLHWDVKVNDAGIIDATDIRVATPQISPPDGTYDITQVYTITCDTPAASIFYSIDGSNPTIPYAPFTFPDQGAYQVRAIATRGELEPSNERVGYYVATITDSKYLLESSDGVNDRMLLESGDIYLLN